MSHDVIRWQGFSHKELYRLLHEGTGPTASAEPSRRWADIASTLGEVGQDLQAAIDRSGSGWAGAAAGAAYGVLAPLASWAQSTGESATGMRTRVETQGDFLATARAAMPVPEDAPAAAPDPTVAPAVQVIASGTDAEPLEHAASTSAQKAFEVMTAYQHSTDANTGGLAEFSSPAAMSDFGSGLHRHTGGGIVINTPIVSIGIGVPPEQPEGDHGSHGDQGRGHHHHDDWGWNTDAASAAGYVEPRHTYLPAPGSYTGASPMGEPFFAGSPLARLDDGARTGTGTGGPGSGSGSGSGSGNGGGTNTGTGGGTGTGVPGASNTGANPGGAQRGGLPVTGGGTSIGAHPVDMQSAAATSQVAAAAGTPTAASPGAAAAGAGGFGGSGGDSRMPRRLGMDPIGSGQWFGDPVADVSTVGGASTTRRRRDFGADRVTESVSIDGEEHQLPPGVIGEGPR
jgi:hypothetical protein